MESHCDLGARIPLVSLYWGTVVQIISPFSIPLAASIRVSFVFF